MSSWYFVKDGQRNGPMGREALDAHIFAGEVDGATLVWRSGMSEWAQASKVPELGVPPITLPPPLPTAGTAGAPREAEDVAGAAASAQAPAPDFAHETRAGQFQAQWGNRTPAPAIRTESFAGFWVRLAAKLIDFVVLYAFAALVERALVHLVFDGVAPAFGDWAGMWRMLSYAAPINLSFALLYTVFFMLKHEATPGKRILGLRVVKADGGRLTAGHVAGRFFAELLSRITFFAGYVMAAFDDEKRTLHDYLCDTRVVRGPREDGR